MLISGHRLSLSYIFPLFAASLSNIPPIVCLGRGRPDREDIDAAAHP